MTTQPTLREYHSMLRAHDWLYAYSDDPGVWKKAQQEETRLSMLSKISSKHQDLFKDFRHAVMTNKEFPPVPEDEDG